MLFASLGAFALWFLVGLAALGVVVYVINKRLLSTGFQVAKAKAGDVARDLEAKNALSLMKQGIDECTEQVRKAKTALIKVQANITGLESRVKAKATEEARLMARIKQAMDEGKKDDDAILKQLGTTLKTTRGDLKTNRDLLESQHSIYNDLLGQMQNAQRRAETLEGKAESLGAQLETSKLTAELADFASSFDSSGIDKSLEGVGKYGDLVQKQIDENNAKLKVNKDLRGDTTTSEWEADTDVKDLLSEIRNNGKA